jgi:hypothetical protein
MIFSLEYTEEAEQKLAQAWITLNNRNAMVFGQIQIDNRLIQNPNGKGKELCEGLWKIVYSPLVAYFEINEKNK